MQKHYVKLHLLLLLLLAGACQTKKAFVTEPEQNHPAAAREDTSGFMRAQTATFHTSPQPAVPQIQHTPTPAIHDLYEEALEQIGSMLSGRKPLDFKRAVYLTENAYLDGTLSYDDFNTSVEFLAGLCKAWMTEAGLNNYPYPDSVNVLKNAAIFHVLKDSVFFLREFMWPERTGYNFSDFSGEKNWTDQFVTSLLATGTGNCHSLPFLYKILANELQAEAYLSLAPNHIYLKHRNKWLGWYNTELTSGRFPTDAWVKASGYITLDAIRNGIYMDTLGQKASVALCAYDLAKGYEMKTRNYENGFIISACDLVLLHYPKNVNAMILKAETLRKNYDLLLKENNTAKAEAVFSQMQELYMQALKMGYRDMPAAMYQAWLQSAKSEDEKFINQKINRTFNSTTK